MSLLSKEQEQWVADLFSSSDKTIIAALKKIKDDGNEHTLVPILKLLINTQNPQIQEDIIQILNELKNPRCTQILVDAINNSEYSLYQLELIQALWESGLDCSLFIEDLVKWAIEGDFQVANEAITVIENINPPYYKEQIKICLLKLEKAIVLSEEIKQNLLISLQKQLEIFLNFEP